MSTLALNFGTTFSHASTAMCWVLLPQHTRFQPWVCHCGLLVTGGRGKAFGLTFGIRSANRNKKSPFDGQGTVFFLTRDLSADDWLTPRGRKEK